MKYLFAILTLVLVFSAAQAQAPWLPEEEQAKVRGMLPDGVPFSDTARVYKLPQVFQSRFSYDFVEPVLKIIAVDDKKTEHPWKVSGGMHFVPTDQWRNITALDLGGKKIVTWREPQDAAAGVLVDKRIWKFPEGAIAYDILVRRWPLGEERVFEVRIHERLKDGWGNAQTYRPDVPADGQVRFRTWEFNPTLVFANLTESRVNIKASAKIVHVAPILGQVKFVDRKEVLNDDYLIPKDYAGAGASCTACHSRNLVGQRTGYGTAVRGGDGRFTWHPWGADGGLDRRWPLEEKKG